jgi:hypothetical protein
MISQAHTCSVDTHATLTPGGSSPALTGGTMQHPMKDVQHVTIWLSRSDNGLVLADLAAYDSQGAQALHATEEFGPFDENQDIVNWVWTKLSIRAVTIF